jgi:hypothetical protein
MVRLSPSLNGAYLWLKASKRREEISWLTINSTPTAIHFCFVLLVVSHFIYFIFDLIWFLFFMSRLVVVDASTNAKTDIKGEEMGKNKTDQAKNSSTANHRRGYYPTTYDASSYPF